MLDTTAQCKTCKTYIGGMNCTGPVTCECGSVYILNGNIYLRIAKVNHHTGALTVMDTDRIGIETNE